MIFRDPFNELFSLQRSMNRLFDDYAYREEQFPAVNVWSNEENAKVTAEIPGLDSKDISLKVVNNQLTIEAKRKEEAVEGVFHRRERGYGEFSRIITLPYPIEGENVSASYKHGILEITLPRKEETKPKKIEISVA